MTISQHLAKSLCDVYFGGNWTASNLKTQLADVTWQQATRQVYGLNTIATLVYHLNYYVIEVTKVLQGEPLTASDKFAFSHPPIQSREDWEQQRDRIWADAEVFAQLIEQLPDEKLVQDFADPKYGTYYRNLAGIIEHIHYHLGQIAVLKKLVNN
ncbi:MAG: DinB family protein [Saprospiraceae bacterium]|nr:DinB family protein [Saprospiraceae bacterium]